MVTVKAIIQNPEVYLDDPANIHFETGVKNRKYELVKSYRLSLQNTSIGWLVGWFNI